MKTTNEDLTPLHEDLFIPYTETQNSTLHSFVEAVYAIPAQHFSRGNDVREAVLMQYLDYYITERDQLEAVAPFTQYMSYINELGNLEPVQSRVIMSMYNSEDDEMLDTLKSVGYYKANYVIHEHDASSLHWDPAFSFRTILLLEVNPSPANMRGVGPSRNIGSQNQRRRS